MSLLEKPISKTTYLKILIALVIIVVLLVVLEYISFLRPAKYSLEKDTKLDTNPNMVVHIDVLEKSGSQEIIAGYAYMKDDPIETVDSHFVLKSEGGNYYKLKTSQEQNENAPEGFRRSGIKTRFLSTGLKQGRYEIYVLYKNNSNNLLADTGIYIDL